MNQPQPGNPAEMYEFYFVPAMFRPWAEILLRHAAARPGERLLDLACGTGIVARLAAPETGPDGQVVGLDMNPAMLAVARSLPPPDGASINWQQGNAMQLPFPDGAFDIVLCQHGLQFFPDPVAAAREMRRVLAPGGRALAIVLQSLQLHPVFEALMQSVARHLSLPLSDVMTPFALHDADALAALFTTAGFATVEVRPETTGVRFPQPQRFVSLAVTSSAAAVPAFAQLEAPARAELLQAVQEEVEPIVGGYRDADSVSFPMLAQVAVAIG